MNHNVTVLRGEAAPPMPATPAARLHAHLTAHKRYRQNLRVLSDADLAAPLDFDRCADNAARRAAYLRDRALRIVRDVPELPTLESLRQTFFEAANGKAARLDIVSTVSAMLDGRANFDPVKRAGYVDVLLAILHTENDIEPFSAEAVAAAAYRVLTEQTFAPEPAEFLRLLREARASFRTATTRIDRLIENRDVAEDVLIATGDLDTAYVSWDDANAVA